MISRVLLLALLLAGVCWLRRGLSPGHRGAHDHAGQ
jgi:hypothetical protein